MTKDIKALTDDDIKQRQEGESWGDLCRRTGCTIDVLSPTFRDKAQSGGTEDTHTPEQGHQVDR
jgi:hypothetical protein